MTNRINLLSSRNPGFENDFTDWETYSPTTPVTGYEIVSSPVHEGSKSLRFGNEAFIYVYKLNISILTGKQYVFGCWVINNNPNNTVYLYVKGATPETKQLLTFSSGYKENIITFSSTSPTLECGFGVDAVSGSNVFIDDIFLAQLN